jgi:ADP-ribose pyrophosphatase YjhB (NUDIX family)
MERLNMKEYAGLLLKCENRYMLCRRAKDIGMEYEGLWSVPCGEIKLKEKAEKAAIRETREETQIPIRVEDTKYVTTLKGAAHDGGDFHLYISEIVSELSPMLDYEHDAFGWFKSYSLPRPMDEDLKAAILDLQKAEA